MTTLDGIEFHRSHFTGEPRATCTHCGKVWAHWQDADDLEHDCRYQVDCTECNGEGGPEPIWDEELQRTHVYICGYCAGRGWRWHYPDR